MRTVYNASYYEIYEEKEKTRKILLREGKKAEETVICLEDLKRYSQRSTRDYERENAKC